MPRYFFDIDTGERQIRDTDGIDLPGVESLAAEAFDLLRDLIHSEMPEGTRVYTANVRDESGAVVYWGVMTVRGKRF